VKVTEGYEIKMTYADGSDCSGGDRACDSGKKKPIEAARRQRASWERCPTGFFQ
jgi:hypothetical protein